MALKWKVNVKVSGDKDAQFSPEYTINCDYLVSAVGQLNQPRYPTIPGIEDFKGKMMHSARWDWSYGLEGKRIGVIGNGSFPFHITTLPLNPQNLFLSISNSLLSTKVQPLLKSYPKSSNPLPT